MSSLSSSEEYSLISLIVEGIIHNVFSYENGHANSGFFNRNEPKTNGNNEHKSNGSGGVNVFDIAGLETEDADKAKTVSVTSASFNEGDRQSVISTESMKKQIKGSTDIHEKLKLLDETDPNHKLRSLCKKGNSAELEEFLKADVDLDGVSEEGWTSLHEIITHECQFTDIAKILMSHGANVNTQDLHGDTPLHSCLLYHCTDNLKLLLNHGANLEIRNGAGRKPVHVANDEESLRILLDHGANVNAPDQLGNTCLHYAVVAKDKERVRLLLSPRYGTNVNVKNLSGTTPLHLASDPEISSLLLEASANPNEVDSSGNSPLHVAVRGRHKEVVRNLLEKNADPTLANFNGKLPLSFAKDKEMRNILTGKTSGSATPTSLTSKKRALSPCTPVIIEINVPNESPGSILKRRRRISNENRERTSRLRFSEVNDYNFVDKGFDIPERRVKVRPIYSEQFSSDDESN